MSEGALDKCLWTSAMTFIMMLKAVQFLLEVRHHGFQLLLEVHILIVVGN